MTEPLCPACAARPQADRRTGLCETCASRRVYEDYVARSAQEAARRRARWRERAALEGSLLEAERERDAERQRRHRLLAAVRPRRPVPPNADPFVLAWEALQMTARLRSALRGGSALELLGEIEEHIRQLAWPLGRDDHAEGPA
jgi:hypothetical protein